MPSPAVPVPDLSRMKKEQLKDACRQRSLSVSGNKPDLILRLENSFVEESTSNGDSGGRGDTAQNGKMKRQQQTASSSGADEREALRAERSSIVLWRRPFTTINYSTRELALTLAEGAQQIFANKIVLVLLIASLVGSAVAYQTDVASQSPWLRDQHKYLMWCLWWVGLGVLSSVGLGTGLHTFLLYLGPHIASVTLAAYECGSTDFPSPPYPDSIVCPKTAAAAAAMTVWQIVSKVRVEAFCWGAGTALGELPPYFMARAARLSGHDPEDDEDDEFLELQEKKRANPDELSYFDRAQLGVERLVEKVGFFGILACASIPNPLFDLAGITCGHFLVPFWTFFGATLIGKAVVKMHIQMFFVILAFNESLLNTAVGYIAALPAVGPRLAVPFSEFLRAQKEKLHAKASPDGAATGADGGANIMSWIFEKFVLLMVAYFLLSIVNSLAQSYHKRINKKASRSSPKKSD